MDLSSLAGTLLKLGGTVIGTALGGPAGGAVAGTILGELAKQFGTEPTPDAVSAAIAADPDAVAKIQAVESSKAADELADLNARLADVQDARQQTIHLAESGSSIAWGAPVVSVLVTVLFAAVVMLLIVKPIQFSDTQATILNILVGILGGAFTQVVNYWLGSSAGSARAGDAIRSIAQQATSPTAGQVVGKVVDAAAKSLSKR